MFNKVPNAQWYYFASIILRTNPLILRLTAVNESFLSFQHFHVQKQFCIPGLGSTSKGIRNGGKAACIMDEVTSRRRSLSGTKCLLVEGLTSKNAFNAFNLSR